MYPDHRCPHPLLSLGQYPVPQQLVARLLASCEQVMVFEDGYPFVEQQLRGLAPGGPKVLGRLDGTLPRQGELDPLTVAKALSLPIPEMEPVPEEVALRPPSMCPGCPHVNTFEFVQAAIAGNPQVRVFSDIGCYTLGALPPFEAIHSCVDMGASITMAKGAADAGLYHAIAVIGDSTFTHSGITGLLDVVAEKTPVTVVIGDNLTTGMTGGQASMAVGRLEAIIAGIGVEPDHLHVVVPLPTNHKANTELLKREMEYRGPSVIIARRACVKTTVRQE